MQEGPHTWPVWPLLGDLVRYALDQKPEPDTALLARRTTAISSLSARVYGAINAKLKLGP